jgi:8-oxo-dGTP diphosphatase
LPQYFTLTQLQTAYESILGTALDKRNFRKKFLSLNLIEPTEKYQRDGAYRPAQLYTFKKQELQVLSRSFE